jgi:hypothetical protein
MDSASWSSCGTAAAVELFTSYLPSAVGSC